MPELLDAEQARLMRAVSRLREAEIRSLLEIGEYVNKGEHKHPAVMSMLAERAYRRQADLGWIASRLRRGSFDGAFVKDFTRYDANPSWRDLRALLDNNIAPATRDSLISKLSGFLGEEAAEKLARGPGFRRRFFKEYSGGFDIRRGDGSLDLMMRAEDNSAIVFAEVKNWSHGQWNLSFKRDEVIEQLKLHNTRIQISLAKEQQNIPADRTHRLLMVAEKGWLKMDAGERRKFVKAVSAQGGWEIQLIPSSMIEEPRDFIDRLRK